MDLVPGVIESRVGYRVKELYVSVLYTGSKNLEGTNE